MRSEEKKIDVHMNFTIITDSLDSQGFCILNSCEFADARVIAGKLGKIVGKTDVTIKHNGKGPLVTSDKALDVHTDHHDVKFVLWYCIENCSQGGHSLLSDFSKFSHALTKKDIDTLQNVFLYEHDVFNSGNTSSPMLRVDEKGNMKIYFSFWHVDDKDKHNSSVKLFHELAKQNIIECKLSAGDILIVDNQRMLHGRTAIMGDKKRHLKRLWIT